MNFDDLILERRAIRNFDEKECSNEIIKEIIKSTIYAPSWKNGENTRYYSTNKETCRKLREALPEFNKKNSTNSNLVVVTFKMNKSGFDLNTGLPVNECGNGWGYYDAGLSTSYFVLKARDLGLDTLIMGIRDAQKVKEILEIPDDEQIVSIIAIGYRKSNPPEIKRKEVKDILINK